MNTEVVAGAVRAPQGDGPRADQLVAQSVGSAAGRLLDVAQARHESLPLSEDLRWLRELCGQVVQGGVYLCAGAPGSNKSTLARQVALDLARQGHRSLMILSEEPAARVKAAVLAMTADWPPEQVRQALANIHVEPNLQDWERLPSFFARHVLSPGGAYHGVQLVVVDSVQGPGLQASATRKWQALYQFTSLTRAAGITTFLIAHVTKAGGVAGPKSTEHNVDAVVLMRKAGKARHAGVPKNRFGPEVHRLLPLEVDPQRVVLRVSPHLESFTSVARSYLPGVGVADVQGAVTLPKWGRPARIMAPGLPRREVEQLVACIAQMPGLELDDLDFSIQARLPGDRRYGSVLGLPLCMSLVASFVQMPIPCSQLMLGEVDLCRNVRDLPAALVNQLAQAISPGDVPLPLRLLVPPSTVHQLPSGPGLEVVACRKLDDAVLQTWSALR